MQDIGQLAVRVRVLAPEDSLGRASEVIRASTVGMAPVASGSKVTNSDDYVTVRFAMGWTGIDASYGSVWYRPSYPLRFR